MLFVGIDPGVSGGLAAVDDYGAVVMSAPLRDMSRADVLDFLRECKAYDKTLAFLERVGVMPGEGPVGAFTFGRNAERVEFALEVVGIPFDIVPPKVWQIMVGLQYPPKAKKVEKKNLGKQRAELLYEGQQLTITHALADAMLIAEACRRNVRGSVQHPRRSATNGKESAAPVSAEARNKEGAEAGRSSAQSESQPGARRSREHANAEARSGSAAPRNGRREGHTALEIRKQRRRRAPRTGRK